MWLSNYYCNEVDDSFYFNQTRTWSIFEQNDLELNKTKKLDK